MAYASTKVYRARAEQFPRPDISLYMETGMDATDPLYERDRLPAIIAEHVADCVRNCESWLAIGFDRAEIRSELCRAMLAQMAGWTGGAPIV